MVPKILVIKLGALGDFIQATGPFKAIRQHHRCAHITLLTTPAFVSLASDSSWFDEVWVDERPSWYQAKSWLLLRRRMIKGSFTRIYDLQTSDRSGWYFRQLPRNKRPEWSGVVRGCSHPHVNLKRNTMHTIDRQAEQLCVAGIKKSSEIDVNWLRGDIGYMGLSKKIALLVPGGARKRREKRWPQCYYAMLASKLMDVGLQVCLIGDESERDLQRDIAAAASGVVELAGETTLGQVATLGRSSHIVVGNDTGPMHILAASGAPTVVLFGKASNPVLCAPRGRNVTVVEAQPHGLMKSLSVQSVWKAIEHRWSNV